MHAKTEVVWELRCYGRIACDGEGQMHAKTEVVWEPLDIEDEEWNELVSSAGDRPEPFSRGRVTKIGAVLVLVLMSILAILGYLHSETQLADRQDIAAITAWEDAQSQMAGSRQIAEIRRITLTRGGAVASVAVTETAMNGAVRTCMETRFYRRVETGWQRAVPPSTFWGQSATLHTAHFHFMFYERDRPFIDQLAADAELEVARLRISLGIGPWSSSRWIVVIAAVPGQANRERGITTICLTSPALQCIAADEPAEASLNRQLKQELQRLTVAEALDGVTVLPQWKPLKSYLYRWLDRAQIQLLDENRVVAGRLERLPDVFSAPLYELTSNPRMLYPGAVFVATDADRVLFGTAFIDFVVQARGDDAIPHLLWAIGHCRDWNDLAETLFERPLDKVEQRFAAFLCARSTGRTP